MSMLLCLCLGTTPQQIHQESTEDSSSAEIRGSWWSVCQQLQTDLDSIFMLLEDHIVTFVKNELKKIQTVLTSDYPECLESQRG
ncbi:hypothetical protein F7725_025753 [Dissostichus mawsoni]|uniref:Uncharacterized protein n=1 Tax=Dissostichus mawsoni TaxID=36200 RepID=A0A7J5X6J1_DISMA|nr:hypothetical protein F7725_025753 [Dissostichus mawsoni]